jgi:endoglucanase
MKKLTILLLNLSLIVLVDAQTPALPFPHHVTYTAGTIRPTNQTQVQIDSEVSSFYTAWKAAYLKVACGDATQYYVEYINGPAICVSEGQGYGMVIVAYMAGFDSQAKVIFDGLYKFYKMHPSTINPALMNWQESTGCVSSGTDSAIDGDLDIAFGLLLADKQWGSAGTINYLQEAQTIIAAIKQDEIYGVVNSTQLGDWAHTDPTNQDDTRPSDFMYDHFRAFEGATTDNTWNSVMNECYTLVNTLQTNFSPVTGLLPDFVEDCDNVPHPAAANFLEGPEDGYFYYNACRTPWHLGVDYLVNGDIRAKNACDLTNAWIRTHTSNNINNIHSGYKLNGTDIAGNNYLDLPFMAPLAVGACVNATNQTWLNDLWTYVKDEPIGNADYYGNTIKMLCMIVIAGDYWVPQYSSSAGLNPLITAESSVQIYPNPLLGNTILKTNVALKNATVLIYNSLGQEVARISEISGKELSKNGLNLAKGIYRITLNEENKVILSQNLIVLED